MYILLTREKPRLSHRVTQIRAHALSECLSAVGETGATHSCFPPDTSGFSISLSGSTFPAQPRNVEAPQSPVLDHLLCSLFLLPTRGAHPRPGLLLPAIREGSPCLPSPFLSSQLHTCTSSCLLNITTWGLRRPSASTCTSQTHILHVPNLVPLQGAGPSTIPLGKPEIWKSPRHLPLPPP